MKIAPTFTARTVLSNFGPWIVYGVVSAGGFRGWAFVCGLIVLLCQLAFRRKVSAPKIMDWVSLLFLAGGAVFTLALRSSLFTRNGSTLLWIALSIIAWGSLLAHAPFTAEYARESVPETVWDSPGFRRVNVVITAAWGTVFVLSAFVAAILALHPGWLSGHVKTWIGAVPYIATIFGIVFTNCFPQWASKQWAGRASL